MPFINGVFKRGYNWVADQAAGIYNLATRQQADAEDIAAGLSLAILRDGTGSPTIDIPWNGKTITGIRQAVAAGEPMEFAQAQAAIQAGQTSPNRLHNSGFAVNQRGVSGTVNLAAGAYGHDRWKAGAAGCSYTFAGNGPDLAVTIMSGSLLQVVHPADVQSGAYVLSQDGAGTAQARIYQGSASGSFAACPVSVTGLTAGTAIVVEFGPGTVIRPQLIQGATTQSYNRKSVATELECCFAFFEVVIVAFSWANAISGSSGYGMNGSVSFHPKVTVPTIGTAGLSPGGLYSGGIIVTSKSFSSVQLSLQNTGQGATSINGTMTVSADL